MAIVLAIILILALILLFTFASTVSYTLTSFIWPENKSSATVEIDNNDTCDDDTDFNSNQKVLLNMMAFTGPSTILIRMTASKTPT